MAAAAACHTLLGTEEPLQGHCISGLLWGTSFHGKAQNKSPPTPAHSPVTKTHYFKTSICLADLRHKAILYLPGTEDSSIGIMPASSLHPEQETLDDVHWSICCLVLMASLDTKRLSKESLEGNKG